MQQDWTKYFEPKTLSRLEGLCLRSKLIAGGSLAGAHRSHRSGQAIEFAQHREYSPGDEVRQIDWKIYGRTDKYYLKQHEDETSQICYVILDCSESMSFQGTAASMSKLEYGKRLAAAVAFVVTESQDMVALATVTEQVAGYIPPSAQKSQLASFGEMFLRTEASGQTKLSKILDSFVDVSSGRGLVVVISDMQDLDGHYESGLSRLRYEGHDVIVFNVMDRDEREFPYEDSMRFVGLESMGSIEVDGYGIRKAYQAEVDSFINGLQATCRSLGFDYATMMTDEPISAALPQFLASRK